MYMYMYTQENLHVQCTCSLVTRMTGHVTGHMTDEVVMPQTIERAGALCACTCRQSP